MARPSSTITAATLAGLSVSFAWQLVATFTDVEVSAGMISASVVLISSLVGFFKRENVLPVNRDEE